MSEKYIRNPGFLRWIIAIFLLGLYVFPMNSLAGDVKWKFNNILPDARRETGILKKFAELTKERTEGRVDIKVFSGGSLGVRAVDTLRWLPKGFPETGLVYANFLGRDAPQLANVYPVGIAGTAEDHNRAIPVVETIIFDELRNWKIEPIGTIRYAAANVAVFSRNEPVSSLEALRKKKIRVWSKHQVDTFRRLGVSAIIVRQSELYVALKTGVVDCALYPDSLVPSISLQEVVKYRSHLFDMGPTSMVLGASAMKWQKLSKEDQEHVRAAALTVRDDPIKTAPKRQAFAEKKMDEGGVETIAGFSDSDRQAFFTAAAENWKETCAKIGQQALQNSEKILKAIGR